MSKLIDFESYPISPVLDRLLQDKTTKQNIIFATDAYLENGPDFAETAQITVDKLLGYMKIKIQPRVEKAAEEQLARTRKKAEVFTPSWIVNKMNNHCDEEWFDRPNVFNTETGTSWVTSSAPITFDGKLSWKGYVDSKRLEITCGEAPYIVSRYDAATGDIIPIKDRIGILDRKLRVVSENAADDAEWLKWAERALQSSYGYEFQGDNLLIARGNVLHTFAEYYEARFAARPDIKLLRKVTNIICWNFWQMDGLTGTIPFSIPKQEEEQITLLDFFDNVVEEQQLPIMPICRVMDWRKDCSICLAIKSTPPLRMERLILKSRVRLTMPQQSRRMLLNRLLMISRKSLRAKPLRALSTLQRKSIKRTLGYRMPRLLRRD